MLDKTLLFVSAVFFLAGFVKGVIGLGLPTIAMGLLAIVMSPVEAAGLLILPSLLTNAWQISRTAVAARSASVSTMLAAAPGRPDWGS
jgi:uncharacterized membrane protein YfcA